MTYINDIKGRGQLWKHESEKNTQKKDILGLWWLMLIMSSVKMRVLHYFGTIKDAGLTL